MEGLVQIAYYFDSTTAQIDRALLDSAGIPAEVFVEDLGRQGPSQGRLMVPSTAVDEACEVLEIDPPGVTPEPLSDKSWGLTVGIVLLVAVAAVISLLLRA